MTSDLELGLQIELIVEESGIDAFIRECLAYIQTNDDLVHFFRRFALYNQPFPGGVATLAGAFHLRTDLFLDRNAVISDNADRSSVIASNIFFAAEDEYASRNRLMRVTHRAMAQEVVEEVIDFAGWTTEQFNEAFVDEIDHRQMATALKEGYRVHSGGAEADLFLALGFHLGSERLADIEFNALNDRLLDAFPQFVERAKETRGEQETPIYSWVDAHTHVEEVHYQYSLSAAGQAIDYYAGTELNRSDIVALILEGFNEFVDFQRIMFVWLRRKQTT